MRKLPGFLYSYVDDELDSFRATASSVGQNATDTALASYKTRAKLIEDADLSTEFGRMSRDNPAELLAVATKDPLRYAQMVEEYARIMEPHLRE